MLNRIFGIHTWMSKEQKTNAVFTKSMTGIGIVIVIVVVATL